MPRSVKCMVEECVFNEHHNCGAQAIEVTSNGNDIVGTNKGTMCGTFRYRDFDDGHASHQPGVHT